MQNNQQAQANIILNQMIEFIKNSGKERCNEIEKHAEEEFTVQREKTIDAQKDRINKNYVFKLKNEDTRMKQEKSADQNKARIERMKMINNLVEKLKGNAQEQLHSHFNENQDQYTQLLSRLLL